MAVRPTPALRRKRIYSHAPPHCCLSLILRLCTVQPDVIHRFHGAAYLVF